MKEKGYTILSIKSNESNEGSRFFVHVVNSIISNINIKKTYHYEKTFLSRASHSVQYHADGTRNAQ